MRHFISTLLGLLMVFHCSFAQVNIPAQSLNDFDVQVQLNNHNTVSCLGIVNDELNQELLNRLNIEIGSRIGNIVTVRIPKEHLTNLNEMVGFDYLQVAGIIKPELSRAVSDLRADSVHQGILLDQA